MVSSKLEADLDDRRAAERVDPERQTDLLADLVRQRRIKLVEKRLRSGRRQQRLRQEIDDQPQPVLGDAAELRAISALRVGFVDVDQGRDLARHRGREIVVDQAPLPLNEHKGDHRLQHHHRQDDDQQRAGIKSFRQRQLEPLGEAVPGTRNRRCNRADRRRRQTFAALNRWPAALRRRPTPSSKLLMAPLTATPPGDSPGPARSGRTADWRDRFRLCGAAG